METERRGDTRTVERAGLDEAHVAFNAGYLSSFLARLGESLIEFDYVACPDR